jgi:hypothetical protein
MVQIVGQPVASADEATNDVVLDWNLYATSALGNAPTAAVPGAGQSPTVAALHLAIVHGAIYDAVNSIEGGYEPYLAGLPPAPSDASQVAAAATAAHHVLVNLVMVPPLAPDVVAWLDARYAESLADVMPGSRRDAGVAAGTAAAAAMLDARADDGRYVPFSLTPGTAPGQWRPELPAFVSDPFAWAAFVDPFALTSPAQFRTNGPLALTSTEYAREFDEVKSVGGRNSARTAEQQALSDFYFVNAVELFHRTFRTLAATRGLSLAEDARLFALLSLAGGDAAISCWNEKAFWSFWRPITAIRQGDADGNPRTIGDPTWLPLINTPPYSDHTSGYNCLSGAMMHAAKAFFGTNRVTFTVTRIAPGLPDATRTYERFTDLIPDTIDARVFQGVHFRTADVQGARLGRDVARWLTENFLQPLRPR